MKLWSWDEIVQDRSSKMIEVRVELLQPLESPPVDALPRCVAGEHSCPSRHRWSCRQQGALGALGALETAGEN